MYTELIKNFNRVRAYMREFYVYGFRSREEFEKSPRTYDDERRRLEGWLKDYMRFRYTPEGKAVFFSFDCRKNPVDPFFHALRAKSFTDGDIVLHFGILSMLGGAETKATARDLLEGLTVLMADFPDAPVLDESTVRGKLKEYCALGLLETEKQGNKLLYSMAEDVPLPTRDALAFASETLPCGALAYYLISDMVPSDAVVAYKHHHILMTLESEVLYALFMAIGERRGVQLTFKGSRENILPLAVLISPQTGRRYVVGYSYGLKRLKSSRLDRILAVKVGEVSPLWQEMRARFEEERRHVWGASYGAVRRLGSVRMRIHIGEGEEYVYRRLVRERRCGTVTRTGEHTAEFYAELYDASEIVPWVRTFLGRIEQLDFSDRTTENRIRDDFRKSCALYGLGEGRDDLS